MKGGDGGEEVVNRMDQAEVVKGEGGLAEGVVAADGEKWSQLEIRVHRGGWRAEC